MNSNMHEQGYPPGVSVHWGILHWMQVFGVSASQIEGRACRHAGVCLHAMLPIVHVKFANVLLAQLAAQQHIQKLKIQGQVFKPAHTSPAGQCQSGCPCNMESADCMHARTHNSI